MSFEIYVNKIETGKDVFLISNIPMHDIDKIFYLKSFRNVTHLIFKNIEEETLKENLFIGFDNLEILNLTCNQNISFEDKCFKSLKKLKSLDISGCNISRLKENLFIGLENLEILNLKCN